MYWDQGILYRMVRVRIDERIVHADDLLAEDEAGAVGDGVFVDLCAISKMRGDRIFYSSFLFFLFCFFPNKMYLSDRVALAQLRM